MKVIKNVIFGLIDSDKKVYLPKKLIFMKGNRKYLKK